METVLNKPFNVAQVELIQLLAQDLDRDELASLRKLLIAFRFKLVEERAERIVGIQIDARLRSAFRLETIRYRVR